MGSADESFQRQFASTEGYLILPEIEGINQLPGVYHYTPRTWFGKRAEFTKELWSF